MAFSNDGITWTAIKKILEPGAEYHQCLQNSGDPTGLAVSVEAAGVIRQGSSIYIIALEGSIPALNANATNTQRTLTFLYTSTVFNPLNVNYQGEVSKNGMFNPNIASQTLYRYWVNVGVAFDSSTGNLYMGRVYPYPFDLGNVTPCNQTPSCLSDISTLPVRAQAYRMNIGSLSNISAITTGTWTQLVDWGHVTGYKYISGSFCVSSSLVIGQTNKGIDFDSINFLRTPYGLLHGTRRMYLAGLSGTRSQGNCVTPDSATAMYDAAVP